MLATEGGRNPDQQIGARNPTRVELELAQVIVITSGELKADEILSAERGAVTSELAAWAMVARVLLNLNENITRG